MSADQENMQTLRKEKLGCLSVLGYSAIIASALGIVTFFKSSVDYDEYKNQSIAQVHKNDYTPATKKKLIKEFLAKNNINQQHTDGFFDCTSDYTFTKNENLSMSEIFQWCLTEFKHENKFLKQHTNYDLIVTHFSRYDGSHRPLENHLKQNINDPKSYGHIKTSHNVDRNTTPPKLTVKTVFKSNNEHGAPIKNTAIAHVDMRTGEIIELHQQ